MVQVPSGSTQDCSTYTPYTYTAVQHSTSFINLQNAGAPPRSWTECCPTGGKQYQIPATCRRARHPSPLALVDGCKATVSTRGCGKRQQPVACGESPEPVLNITCLPHLMGTAGSYFSVLGRLGRGNSHCVRCRSGLGGRICHSSLATQSDHARDEHGFCPGRSYARVLARRAGCNLPPLESSSSQSSQRFE